MPKLKKRPPPPTRWPVQSGGAAGLEAKDFYLLGFSEDYDDFHYRHDRSTEHYTHILHFKNLVRCEAYCVPYIVNVIWWNPIGKAYAVGHPPAIVEIDDQGCREMAFPNLPGVFMTIWGTGDDHVFACGVFDTFVLYRRYGSWHDIPLPKDISTQEEEDKDILVGIRGFNENDVYFSGSSGTVLHFDGQQLHKLDVPTDVNLGRIALLDDHYLCIGGNAGVILFGNKSGWRFVPSGVDWPIYLVSYMGMICYATPGGIYAFDGKTSPRLLVDKPAFTINALKDALVFSDFEKNTWLYDGQNLTLLDTAI